VVVAISLISILLMTRVNNLINKKVNAHPGVVAHDDVVVSEGY